MSKKLATQHLCSEVSRLSYATCNAETLGRLFSALSWYMDAAHEEAGLAMELQDLSRKLEWEAGSTTALEALLEKFGCVSLKDLDQEFTDIQERLTKLEDQIEQEDN